VKGPSIPKEVPKSLQILRRRILEERYKPGRDGKPRFASDADFARVLGVDPSHVSHVLRARKEPNRRGVSWALVDRLADALDVDIWELFFVSGEPYKWRTK
jgi:hypothetical protein